MSLGEAVSVTSLVPLMVNDGSTVSQACIVNYLYHIKSFHKVSS